MRWIRTTPLLLALCCASLAAGTEKPMLGTGVSWDTTPAAAFSRAAAQGKLVLLLHVSGNFDQGNET